MVICITSNDTLTAANENLTPSVMPQLHSITLEISLNDGMTLFPPIQLFRKSCSEGLSCSAPSRRLTGVLPSFRRLLSFVSNDMRLRHDGQNAPLSGCQDTYRSQQFD
jgi:hypothetical protein